MKNLKKIAFIILLNSIVVGCVPIPTGNPFVCGTSTIVDADGNTYHTVSIGSQCWTVENLKTTKYTNGDVIPEIRDSIDWVNQTSGARCVFNNETINGAIYGNLYNGYTMIDSRKLAPLGWHIPTDNEWKALEMNLGMSQLSADSIDWRGTDQGAKLKETGTVHWVWPTGNVATNSSGFTALGSGWRNHSNPAGYPSFINLTNTGQWWSSSLKGDSVWIRNLCVYKSGVYRISYPKTHGCSVRFIKD